MIKSRQDEYYQAFREADIKADCSNFIEFLLQALATSLKEAINNSAQAQRDDESKMRVEMKVKTRVKTPDKILSLLTDDPSPTLVDIAAYLDLSKSTVERAVAKLKKQGKLNYIGPKKGGYWEVV